MPRKNNSELDPNIGDRLRMRRLMLGMSQEALSEELSLTFQQIQKYQKGTNWVSASRLYELAQAPDEPVQYFFTAFRPKMRRCCKKPLPKPRIRHRLLTSCSAGREFN